ncbi:RPA-related protein RADX-like isoform X2 [Narcine bancroftii]|uniref:RPA-related protein RADX-like isoform X2 n=1 Tax=Narcine bancroftii TaxID=1343680 RepID=UPI0038316650
MAAAKAGSRPAWPAGNEFWVLAVERYLLKEAGLSRYDVTLCGGVLTERAPLKCLLAPRLNRLVQRNDLRSGCRLRVAKLRMRVDGVRVLDEVEVLEARSPPPLLRTARLLPCPLLRPSSHYMPLWEESDYYGEEWIGQTSSQEQSLLEGLRTITLKELVFAYRGGLKLAPLLVRIMYKSKLRHYGKTAKNIDWPYLAHFEVGDSSGMTSMVLWNSLCPRFFRSLEVGTVIFVQQYAVKDAYQKRTQPFSYYPDLTIYNEIEISLNASNPGVCIKVIPRKQVKHEWELPDVKYQFITRDRLDTVPDGYICDVIGLVTFVGRCERIKKAECGDEFWVRRFVEMVDETSAEPFILELYCTSQPEIYQRLHPVTFLVCCQMRVVKNKFNNTTYLTSSYETQIYITGYHKGRPYTTNTTVKRFLQWAKSQHEKDFLKKSLIGGYYSFPPLPSSFQVYCQNMKEVNFITLHEFKEKIERLYYREHKNIVIQGIITAVRYITHTSSNENLMHKKYIQPVNTKNSANMESRDSSTEYRHSANNQVAEQEYFCNFRDTFQTFNQILESEEEVLTFGRKLYNLRSMKKEYFQSYALETTAQDQNLLSSSEETEDEYFTADEDFPEMDDDARSKPLDCTWESSKWSEIKRHLKEFLSFGQLLHESCPQKFDYAKKEAIMSQHNLHPSRFDSYQLDSNSSDGKFTTTAWTHCYYTVTIVDLNQEVAMDVVFLPLGIDKIFSNAARISNFISILSGDCTSETPSLNGSELEGKHFWCVLDVYHHGNDQTEVILNRAYKKE